MKRVTTYPNGCDDTCWETHGSKNGVTTVTRVCDHGDESADPNAPVVVCGAIIDDRGRGLVEWRDDFGPGFMFPGGKPEGDEPPHVTLAREVREELGVTILESEPLDELRSGTYRCLPYLVTAWTGWIPERTRDAGHRLSWRNLEEQAADDRWPASREIARRVLARMQEGWTGARDGLAI